MRSVAIPATLRVLFCVFSMTFRQYLSIMILGTFCCAIAWVFVLINVDPTVDSGPGLAFFYGSLYLLLIGITSVCLLPIYQFFLQEHTPLFRMVKKAFYVGIVLSTMLTSLLFLQGKGLLSVWNIGMFIGIFVFLFLFRLSVRLHRANQTTQ